MYIPTSRADYFSQGVSNSHIYAKECGKITAGEAAKILSKKFAIKILAKDIKPLSTEWHHSGAFKGNNGTLAGKTYFFTKEQVDSITLEKINQVNNQLISEKQALLINVQGWYIDFKKVSINRYGKLGWKPFLGIYEGEKGKAPKSFVALTDEQMEIARLQKGRQLEPYEKPTF
jgi:hypothetical protein